MNEHPQDLLAAFTLGALDAAEASQVMQHVAVCATCRADIESLGAVVGLLPYSVAPQDPPAAVKHRLFAMIAASSQAQPGEPPAARSRLAGPRRWVGAAAAGVLALALVFGLLFIGERGRADTLTAQLGEREQALQQMRGQFEQQLQQLNDQLAERDRRIQEIDGQLGQREQTIEQMRTQLDRERQEMVFVSNAVSQPLHATQAGAEGKMFMRPDNTHALLVLSGLKQPAAGKVYQFWFATADQQVPSRTFAVGPDGAATVSIEAPAAVDSYAQVMVTIEPEPGSQRPSAEVVLEATL